MISKKIFLGVIISSLIVTTSANADELDDEWAEIDAIANENSNARVDNTPISIQEWRKEYFGENPPNENQNPPDEIQNPPDENQNPPDEIQNPPDEIQNPPDEIQNPPDEIQNPPVEIEQPPEQPTDPNEIQPIKNPPTNEQIIENPLNKKPNESISNFPSYDDLFSTDNTSKKNPTYDQSDMLPPVDDDAVKNWLENYSDLTFRNSQDDVYKTDEELAKEREEAEKAFQKAVKAAPYKAMFVESPNVYLLNRPASTWKRVPYKIDEYMVDCWICIVETDEPNQDLVALQMSTKNNVGDRKFTVQHYLIRPLVQRIQYVSGFEVEGRSKKTINERAYDPSSWQEIIPGTIEEAIYQGVIEEFGTKKAQEKGHMTLWDHLDKDLGIAIK